jgi:hypothetical protein
MPRHGRSAQNRRGPVTRQMNGSSFSLTGRATLKTAKHILCKASLYIYGKNKMH